MQKIKKLTITEKAKLWGTDRTAYYATNINAHPHRDEIIHLGVRCQQLGLSESDLINLVGVKNQLLAVSTDILKTTKPNK